MYLFGTWHPRILRVIESPGTRMGWSVWVVRPPVWADLKASEIKPAQRLVKFLLQRIVAVGIRRFSSNARACQPTLQRLLDLMENHGLIVLKYQFVVIFLLYINT